MQAIDSTSASPFFNAKIDIPFATAPVVPDCRLSKSLISFSYNYDVQPRLNAQSLDKTRLACSVETSLRLEEIKVDGKHRGWMPIFDGEKFLKVIAGGGSGASVALLRNTHDQLIVRKLLYGVHQKEAALAQNLESIGQAILTGKEPSANLKPKIKDIFRQKSDVIDSFVRETRPEVTKRFVVLEATTPSSKKYTACGYDQTAFASDNQTTAPEFAKAIQNTNQPLVPARLQKLMQAQLNLVHIFQKAQQAIYLEPVTSKAGKEIFYNTYLAKFEKRLGTGFDAKQLTPQCFQPLLVKADMNNTQLQLNALLLAPKITVNGQTCVNPLAYAHAVKDSFTSHKEGILLHGDLQPTNAILLDTATPSLRCIDNRGTDIEDYLADLSKILWGPKFVPIMEDMLDVNCFMNNEMQIETTAKPGLEHSVANMHLFGNSFYEEIQNNEADRAYLQDNTEATSQLLFTAGVQYLRDLGFVLPRLQAATESGDTEAALKFSRRVIADFAAAAIDMTQHQAMNKTNETVN